ncbi:MULTISPECIES: GTP-binding protein [unclassified Pseudomonas]|uniref:CobW family GTP-binding protein n=1 Tax=unclassified Pseudomonas TaxID=196821 RepID=UPI001295360E|nr:MULTISPECIES: CobW family GTP-binding protein [unclassified Pseudomonas]MQT42687.1 cobalamin biosynthesis protein CobW [Pseudomonas sp. FSL R10-0765]MQT51892.1 cobalamin biosynthesis protein CobW [Pseudomonas sp. FSL R10-2398]MQU02808.1 cobalamin biosynthesis protein CobW [Pseudomonas sp. FSL R10-2245]MQU12321.1 cobalamin biosynthesis protein CobW [Pseudomonas sp. FSL R10-2189]MQU38743.1 cobalamin biosynthesis protein CobW [Pseudomonas sp. FSL R10-2172]
MLQNIPTHVIAGPLGAGKTSLIQHLMTQKPADERWAVLVNEFGQIGLDAALMGAGSDAIAIAEVAGGCVCCVNGAPFQIGLSRLLRKARPDRLFIEPSGLGHPAQILKQLSEAPWLGVLALQPCVMVLDAQAMAQGKTLPETQQTALKSAGLLVMNKSHSVQKEQREQIAYGLPKCPILWVENGRIPLKSLSVADMKDIHPVDKLLIYKDIIQIGSVFTDPGIPILQAQLQPEGWSVGWRWHASRQFDVSRLQQWLKSLDWRRAKLVVRASEGWFSSNSVDNSLQSWKPSEWRQDSRLELIFEQPQDLEVLRAGLQSCLMKEGG